MKMLQGFMVRGFPGSLYLHEIRSKMMHKGAKGQSVLPRRGHVRNFDAIISCRNLAAPNAIHSMKLN